MVFAPHGFNIFHSNSKGKNQFKTGAPHWSSTPIKGARPSVVVQITQVKDD